MCIHFYTSWWSSYKLLCFSIRSICRIQCLQIWFTILFFHFIVDWSWFVNYRVFPAVIIPPSLSTFVANNNSYNYSDDNDNDDDSYWYYWYQCVYFSTGINTFVIWLWSWWVMAKCSDGSNAETNGCSTCGDTDNIRVLVAGS